MLMHAVSSANSPPPDKDAPLEILFCRCRGASSSAAAAAADDATSVVLWGGTNTGTDVAAASADSFASFRIIVMDRLGNAATARGGGRSGG